MSIPSLRACFGLEPGLVFLNHGSFGARPREVLEAQDAYRRELEASPVDFLSRRSSALLDAALGRLAAYVGAKSENLAFVTNATTGLAIAAASARLGPGDEVLGSDHEYGACVLGWRRACARAGASWREFAVPLPWAGEADFLSRLEAAFSPRTRVLFLSQVTSPTALRFPVEKAVALAAGRGILTVIDGAHVPAQLPLDLEALGADYYAGNCHKWLCAPLGSAFLYVKPGLHESLVPPIASWGLVAEAEGDVSHDAYVGTTVLARRLRWLGTRDPTPFLAVPAAIDFLDRHDSPARAKACVGLAHATARRAAALLGFEPVSDEGQGLRMALVPLPPCDAGQVKSELFHRHRIEVPATSHGGKSYLRLSFHLYNDETDAEAFLSALEDLRLPRGAKPRG
jgi:isopenicillin-N epimerase